MYQRLYFFFFFSFSSAWMQYYLLKKRKKELMDQKLAKAAKHHAHRMMRKHLEEWTVSLLLLLKQIIIWYGNCPKILYTNFSDKMAYRLCGPRSDCSRRRRSSLIRVYIVCFSTKYFVKQMQYKN